MKKVVLEIDISMHPLVDMKFSEIIKHIEDIKQKYLEYDDFVYKETWKTYEFGAMSGWFELIGYIKENGK